MNNPITVVDTQVQDRVIVCVAGQDEFLDYGTFGLSFESSENDILTAVRPMIREKYGVDLQEEGRWLYKIRKATANRNIYVLPNSTAGAETPNLPYLDNPTRLKMYESLVQGCMHLWSKNKLMDGKACPHCGKSAPPATGTSCGFKRVAGRRQPVQHETPNRLGPLLASFSELAEKDPVFLAHFTSYAFRKLDSKDLKVVAAFASSISDADGTPFAQGSEYHKPNLRIIAQAAICDLDPKLVARVVKELANSKRPVGSRPEATHFSRHLKTALRKYLRYRESNPRALEGIQKNGLGRIYKDLYRVARIAPSPEAVKILRWKQKPGFPGANIEIKKGLDFSGLSDLEIATKIRDLKLKPQAALGALPSKITPVIAAAVLEQCSPDQAVVLTSLFEDEGLLKNREVKALYEEKIRGAKQALDRVDRIQQNLSESTKEALREARSDVRKSQVGEIGKLYLHLDISTSLHQAIEVAKNVGSIFAECVQNPAENFNWGVFNHQGAELRKPSKFTKDAFMAALYGVVTGGNTNCLALFDRARQLGCDTDVYITDGEHNHGDVAAAIRLYQQRGGTVPKRAVIVKVGNYKTILEDGLKAVGIPVAVIEHTKLTESALVTQAIRSAVVGSSAIIDTILETPLLALPKWWESISAA